MAGRERRVVYEFEGFRLDPARRVLLDTAGQPIVLAPKVLDTLLCFVERPGELLDKDGLLEAIWPGLAVEENTLNQNVSILRRALGEKPSENRFIVTVPRRGYRFVPEVREIRSDSEMALARGSALASSECPANSIAVLPFANLTADPEKGYFGEGIAEELIHALSQIPDLKVPARTSSFAYKGRNLDARVIARELGVQALIEGSVRSDEGRIRVTAQLIEGATGFRVWSQSFDHEFARLFELQDELAAAILRAVSPGAHIRPPPRVIGAARARDVEAYELYLQARTLFQMPDERRLRQAMALLNQALARDAGFARALSTLAGVRLHCVLFGYPLANALTDAERNAQRALELDPKLFEAHAALGQLCAFRGRWLEGESNFRASLSSGQHDAVTVVNYCTCLLISAGHLTRAEDETRMARRLAPASSPVAMCEAVLSSLRGNDADAIRLASLATALGDPPDLPPIPQIRAHAERRAGNLKAAAEWTTRGLHSAIRALGAEAVVTRLFAALSEPDLVPSTTAAVRDLADRGRATGAGFAALKDLLLWCTLLGAVDLAHDLANSLLDDAANEGTVGSAWDQLWLPEMRVFREHPRFQALAKRLGLFDYWAVHGAPDGCKIHGGQLICV